MTDGESEKSVAHARQQALEDLTRAMQAGEARAASLDTALLSLSGGALVLSMTFVGQFAPSKLLLPVLFLSWVAFTASLVSLVFAIRASQNEAYRSAMEAGKNLDEIEKAAPSVIAANYTVHLASKVSLATSVRHLNVCAISAFVVGVLLLGVFVGYNLWATTANVAP